MLVKSSSGLHSFTLTPQIPESDLSKKAKKDSGATPRPERSEKLGPAPELLELNVAKSRVRAELPKRSDHTEPPSKNAWPQVHADLQAVLPQVFMGHVEQQLAAPSHPELYEKLAALHQALVQAGHPSDLKPLVAMLADRLQVRELSPASTPAERAQAASLLGDAVKKVHSAIGRGRDGSELGDLYGHSGVLDHAVNALRTAAATQFLLNHLPKDASRPPAAMLAKDLTAAEYAIATSKLEIMRVLSAGNGFAPALSGLRFTPELLTGLTKDHPEVIQRAGVLMADLLIQERQLAESEPGQQMHDAVMSVLSRQREQGDAGQHVLSRRADALKPLSSHLKNPTIAEWPLSDCVAFGFTRKKPAPQAQALGGSGQAGAVEAVEKRVLEEPLLQGLARNGLAGTAEVREALSAANQTLDRVAKNRARILAVNQAYDRGVLVEEMPTFAAGLLRHLAADPNLPVVPGTELNHRMREVLTGPNGVLAPLLTQGDAGQRQALKTQADSYAEKVTQLRMAHADLVCGSFAAFGGPADELHLRAGELLEPSQQTPVRLAQEVEALEHLPSMINTTRREMQELVDARKQSLGAMADALKEAVRAAALLTHPNRQDFAPSDGLVDKVRKTAGQLAQSAQKGVLARERVTLHEKAMFRTLAAWGLPARLVAPEVHQVLAPSLSNLRASESGSAQGTPPNAVPLSPQDAAQEKLVAMLEERVHPVNAQRVTEWATEFRPLEATQGAWQAAQDELAAKRKPAALPGLELAALKRLTEGVDTLDVGTRLSWTDGSNTTLTIWALSATALVPVPGLKVGLSSEHGHQSGIHVERDAAGYQLTLMGGHEAAGALAFQFGNAVPEFFNARLDAKLQGSNHHYKGLALRFPDSDAGRTDMRDMLDRLIKKGTMDAGDLMAASAVLPVTEHMNGFGVAGGGRLVLNTQLIPVSVEGQEDSLDQMPRAHAELAGSIKSTTRTYANQRQKVEENLTSYNVKVPVTINARLSCGIDSMAGLAQNADAELDLVMMLPDEPTDLPVPVYTFEKDLVDLNYQMATRDVREEGLVTEATERVARIKCPQFMADAAVDKVGGSELRVMLDRLKDSDRPQDQKTHAQVHDLIHGAKAGDEISVVWRLNPKVIDAANQLLKHARTALNRQGSHAAPTKAAAQLEAQAKALLADAGNYVLHGLGRVTQEKTVDTVNTQTTHLGMVTRDKRMASAHERVAESVVFDPALVQVVRAGLAKAGERSA